jgi:hypothetical protein
MLDPCDEMADAFFALYKTFDDKEHDDQWKSFEEEDEDDKYSSD